MLAKTSFELGMEKGLELAKTTFGLSVEEAAVKRQRALLLWQLEWLFGPLSKTARDRLECWPRERLAQLGEDLLSPSSLVDLDLEDAAPGPTPTTSDQ